MLEAHDRQPKVDRGGRQHQRLNHGIRQGDDKDEDMVRVVVVVRERPWPRAALPLTRCPTEHHRGAVTKQLRSELEQLHGMRRGVKDDVVEEEAGALRQKGCQEAKDRAWLVQDVQQGCQKGGAQQKDDEDVEYRESIVPLEDLILQLRVR